jgi:TM2 domain-containing membrane protein YozV
MILIALGSVHQSYRHAEEIDGRFGGMDNPAISGMASMIVPGWGQLVNGQPGKAVVFLLGYLSGLYALVLLMFTPLLKLLAVVDTRGVLTTQVNAVSVGVLVVAGIAWLLSVYDAMLVAGFRRRIS